MVSPIQITHVFNGDPNAADDVDAAQLDTQLANIVNNQNAEIVQRQLVVKDGGTLAAQTVGSAQLKPEVITMLSGLLFLQDVAAVAQTNIAALTGTPIIDGYQTVVGDRVLLMGQTAQVQNAIYVIASGAWTIAYDSAVPLTTTAAVSVLNGNSGAGTSWRIYTPGTPGTTVTTWIPIQGFAALLPITRGGTGANSAPQALINLGITAAIAGLVTQCANIAGLRLVAVPTLNGAIYATAGYWTQNDNGSGQYVWNSSSTATDNGFTVIQITGQATGRFLLMTGGLLNVKQAGAKGDGSTDDSAAFVQWAAAAVSGSHLIVPPGNYQIASANIGFGLTFAASNLTIEGFGKQASMLTITGTTVLNAVFLFTAQSYITVKNLGFTGNSQANAYANGVAISWTNTGTTGQLNGFTVQDCYFTNFKGDYWIYAENTAGSYAMREMRVTGCTFISLTGNARGPANIAINSSAILACGHASNALGFIESIHFDGNYGELSFIKSMAQCFANTRDIHINENTINGAGNDASISNDVGAYAIIIYDNSSGNAYPPTRAEIKGNHIASPRSCGMYMAGVFDCVVSGNVITGQTDTTTATLPKGAIVMNGGKGRIITGNMAYACALGIFVQSSATRGDITITSNQVLDFTGTNGIQVSGAAAWSDCNVSDNTVTGAATGIYVLTFNGDTITKLRIANNIIRSDSYGIQVTTGDASYALSDVDIAGNQLSPYIATPVYGIYANGFVGKRLTITENSIKGDCSTAGISVSNSTNLVIRNNFIKDVTSGVGLRSDLAQGVLDGNQFTNVTTYVYNSGGQDLGRLAPTWAGELGNYVQNLAPVEAGSGGSKYVVMGWIYTTAWLPSRTLTGN